MTKIVSNEEFIQAATELLRPAHTLLDIGPGIQPQTMINCVSHVCIEPFTPYAERLSAENPGLIVFNCTWADAMQMLPSNSVDTVILMDVIEHLERDEAEKLLATTVEVARSQVVIQTPLGFMAQGEDESKDAWGMDGVDWQVHRSGWTPEDFPGWQFVVAEKFHERDAYGRELDEPHGAFFAILDKGPGFEGEQLSGQIAELIRESREVRAEYEGSMSWRVTEPLRKLVRLFHRG